MITWNGKLTEPIEGKKCAENFLKVLVDNTKKLSNDFHKMSEQYKAETKISGIHEAISGKFNQISSDLLKGPYEDCTNSNKKCEETFLNKLTNNIGELGNNFKDMGKQYSIQEEVSNLYGAIGESFDNVKDHLIEGPF